MNITRIEPPHERWAFRAERCSAECGPQTVRYRHVSEGTKCNWRAWYRIDGDAYCIRHAQALALEFVMRTAAAPQAPEPTGERAVQEAQS